MGRELFPRDIASAQEHIALVERVCGPFSLDLAANVEKSKPGTFCIRDCSATVRFPAEDFDPDLHTEPLRRLQRAKPIAVSMV